MQAYRRLESNHALDEALRRADGAGKPLVVYEELRLDYPWASVPPLPPAPARGLPPPPPAGGSGRFGGAARPPPLRSGGPGSGGVAGGLGGRAPAPGGFSRPSPGRPRGVAGRPRLS